MKLKDYVKCLFKEFFAACGLLTLVAAVFLEIYAQETISATLLWQIILTASTFTCFKFAFVNKYELDDRAQMYSFFICSLLADFMLLILLFFFSPGRAFAAGLFIPYLLMVLLVKGVVYYMMYANGREQAKLMNAKLKVYRNDRS